MKIYVCVKHVPDSAATITITGPTQINESITFLLNPYDENAVEAAVRIKDEVGQAEVVALTVGKAAAENTLRSALGMGADRGILILSETPADQILTARALAAAIGEDGPADLIFTGRESIDSVGLQTMYRLAANLKLPVVTNAVELALEKASVRVACEVAAGQRDVVRMPLPCVIAAAKGLNQPRYPTFPMIVQARKKEIRKIALTDLDFDAPQSGMAVLELLPTEDQRHARQLSGEPEQIAREIVGILRDEAKVI